MAVDPQHVFKIAKTLDPVFICSSDNNYGLHLA
jgi:hypothetical protein